MMFVKVLVSKFTVIRKVTDLNYRSVDGQVPKTRQIFLVCSIYPTGHPNSLSHSSCLSKREGKVSTLFLAHKTTFFPLYPLN